MARSRKDSTTNREAQRKLREFRHQVAQLKKKRLLDKSIDARKAQPTRNLKKLIRDYQAVIKSESKVWKVGKKLASAYREHGYKTRKTMVILPKDQYVPSRGRDRGMIKTSAQKGHGPRITVTSFPQPVHTLEDFLQNLRDNPPKLAPGEALGFQFMGWNSSELYQGDDAIDRMIRKLQSYGVADWAAEHPEDMPDIIESLVIVKVDPSRPWYELNMARKRKERLSRVKVYKATHRKKQLTPVQLAQKREADAAYQRRHYDRKANTAKKRRQRSKGKP